MEECVEMASESDEKKSNMEIERGISEPSTLGWLTGRREVRGVIYEAKRQPCTVSRMFGVRKSDDSLQPIIFFQTWISEHQRHVILNTKVQKDRSEKSLKETEQIWFDGLSRYQGCTRSCADAGEASQFDGVFLEEQIVVLGGDALRVNECPFILTNW